MNSSNLPIGWEILKFKDCVKQLTTGLNPRKNFKLGQGNIKYITAKNLVGGGNIDFSNCDYINEDAKKTINKRSKIMIGDILFSSRAPIGQTHLIVEDPKDYDIGESIFSIRPKKDVILPSYLSIYLSSDFFIKSATQYVTGSVIQEIRITNLLETYILVPPFKIQQKIVDSINSIDSKMTNNNKIISELESLAKTIYDYWFLQFEFPNEDGKPYKSSGGKMVWNEDLKREIPEGWSTTNVGNITTCLDSKRVPLSSKDRENMKGPYPYYGATSEMDSVNEYLFDGDFVLLAEDGSVMDDKGFPILQRINGKVWVNNHAHVLQPKKPYRCKLLMFILKNIPVSMIKTGSIQMKVNQENLNAFKVLSFPENIIEKANSILDPIDTKIIMLQQENRELASLRDFLLPMLMNGQVTFKD